ncbi:hypothetical protein ABW19_dt0206619 [Dactylella cylindrospora]|nr:hypothetical protein ABW19_dt0206619 [Dactylella cylindrospora]
MFWRARFSLMFIAVVTLPSVIFCAPQETSPDFPAAEGGRWEPVQVYVVEGSYDDEEIHSLYEEVLVGRYVDGGVDPFFESIPSEEDDPTPRYTTLEVIRDELLGAEADREFVIPHQRCRIIFCAGENIGLSVCSWRSSEDMGEVTVWGEHLGNILGEWLNVFANKKCAATKTSEVFKLATLSKATYGFSFMLRDPLDDWSVNISKCGSRMVNFEDDEVTYGFDEFP